MSFSYRLGAAGLAAASAAAMAYVGLYQARFVGRLICPLLARGCEAVADAPFARPFGAPDGFIALGLYAAILALLFAPGRPAWIAALALAVLATLANALGVRDMVRLGAFCFYCLATTVLSPLLAWAIWRSR